MKSYHEMTNQEFDSILATILDENPASFLLFIDGVYEILAEHFNNDVLDRWSKEKQ